jgi:succinate-semialdehyde dehydrogenase/glutarate-semialdehyde dehydrogenase
MKSMNSLEYNPWINGVWTKGNSRTNIKNPATGTPIADVGLVDASQVGLAIDGAVVAQQKWKSISPFERGEVLKRAASSMLTRRNELARTLTMEQGKPLAQALGEVDYAASFFQWFGEEARRIYGRIIPHPDASREFFLEHRPIGVAGLITPWNFPLAQGAKKIAAALAAGCAAVWKPSELTPMIALALGPLLREAGLPDGVLQIVPGFGPVVGAVFAKHLGLRAISVTGSTRTGRAVMASASENIKRISLELGGNAPFIVLPDADLDSTVDQLVRLKLLVSGQVCVTANRVFVHRSIENDFVERVAARLSLAKVGNGMSEGVDAGPLIHAEACRHLASKVSSAVAGGATIVVENQSYRLDDGLLSGSFFPPTLLVNVDDDSTLASEEIFGPVIPILRYDDLSNMIERANATPYGLASYVFGSDIDRCRAVALRLEVGIVGINEWRPLKAEIPFGGVKQSGIGAEGGEEGLKEFLSTTVLSIPKSNLL